MTENPDKFREAKSILDARGIQIRQLKRPKVEVQDSSLEKIARFAVKTASLDHTGLLLVEDSGIFIPEGFRETFGQTKPGFKNKTSHRARAFLKFANWYNRSRTGRHRVRTDKRALK